MSEGTAGPASGEGVGRSPARDWLPVLQDRSLMPFLGWNAEHRIDRSVLALAEDAWVVFDAGGAGPDGIVYSEQVDDRVFEVSDFPAGLRGGGRRVGLAARRRRARGLGGRLTC
ncbi:MAG TPA: hypothetical protein VFJ12_11005 [Segeticoccus sp.]|nr:hypothetical protein [Segeticoccus sp.]